MVRNYKRKKGSRRYCDYPEEKLRTACLEILEGRMSYKKAANHFGIPVGTLYNKYNGKHPGYCGHPTVFSEELESTIVEAIICCGDWAFPLDLYDVRMLMADYLRNLGKFPSTQAMFIIAF